MRKSLRTQIEETGFRVIAVKRHKGGQVSYDAEPAAGKKFLVHGEPCRSYEHAMKSLLGECLRRA